MDISLDASRNEGLALLAEYIQQRTTQRKFAALIGCGESHLSLVLAGKRAMAFGLAKRIVTATGGYVPIMLLPHERTAA
jgi:DNA-binding transcriptional regulator YdaS (Cro superfamily)